MDKNNILIETCLNCGKNIRFTPDDICTDDFGDYIKCPDCGAQSDVNVSCETKLNEYISTGDRPIYDAVESISDYACQLTPGDDIAEDYDNDLVFYIHRNDEDTFDISVGYNGELQYNLSKSDVDILDLDTTLVNIVKSMYKQSDVDKKEELFNVKIAAGNEVLSKKQEGRKKKDSVTEYTITFSDGELYDEYGGEFISEDKDEADELFDSIKAENKLDQVEQYYAKTWIWEGSDYSEDDVKVYYTKGDSINESRKQEARRNPEQNTINRGNSKLDFSNTKRNKFRSVDQANRNFLRDLQGNSAKGSGTWEENPNKTSAEYINNKKEIAANNELINKGKTLSSDDNRLQDVVNNVNQELIKKNQDLKDRNNEIIANKNKKKINKKQEANDGNSIDNQNLENIKDTLRASGIQSERTLDLMSKDILNDLKRNYTNSCKDENGIYYGVVITDAFKKKVQQITGKTPNTKIGEARSHKKDTEKSNTFKNESKETPNKKYPRKIKTADGYTLTKVNDGTPENEYIPVYMNERGDETLVPDVEKYEIIEEAEEENPQAYEYMLLDRLRSDCDYYLGNGNRNDKYLWAGNVDGQIAKMKELWNKLNEKPEWLTMEQIENYAKEMGANELPSSTDGTAKQEIQNMLDRAYNKEIKVGLDEDYEDDDSNKEHYYFNIILSTSNPNAPDFKKLSHHIENLIDYNEFDYPIDIYNVEVKPDTDNTVIVKGNMDITFDEDPLSQDELNEYLYDFIDVTDWSDLDVEIESISLQLTESKKSLTEREWKYKFDNSIKSAINSGDTKAVIETVRRYCDDIQKADVIDSDTKSKFESYINYYNDEFNWVLDDIQNNPDNVRTFDDFMNKALSDLYDLCDEAGIFIELL